MAGTAFVLLSTAARVYGYEAPRNYIVAGAIITLFAVVPAAFIAMGMQRRRAIALALVELPTHAGRAIAAFVFGSLVRTAWRLLAAVSAAVLRVLPFAALTAAYVVLGFGTFMLYERLQGTTGYGMRSYDQPQVVGLAVAAAILARVSLDILGVLRARMQRRPTPADDEADLEIVRPAGVPWLIPAIRWVITAAFVSAALFAAVRFSASWLGEQFPQWELFAAAGIIIVGIVLALVRQIAFGKEEDPHA